ncbi:MAG: hypothetical protein FWD71_11760 [Oscillospiraceae bacterium]|nr:hypothetical protein [Oscillospiraceae bacterium]
MTAVSGFFRYCKFIIKREKIISLVWIIAMAVFNMVVVLAYPRLFQNDDAIRSMVATLATPQMQSLMGPVYGPSVDQLTLNNTIIVFAEEMLIWMMIASAVMNVFFINRHTRTDEELGRLEMFRSLPVGRLTNSMSALTCALGINVVMSVLMALGMIAANVAGTTAGGAFVYSFAIGAVGFLFACITLLTAQLFQSARSASMWAFIIFGIFYIIRMYGDMAGSDMANYISPLGFGLKVYSFWENNVIPIIVILIESVVIAAAALLVCNKRDLGEGVVPAKPGRKNASAFLQNPLGLAWRLTRNMVITWLIVMFCMGAAYGAVIGQITDIAINSEMFGTLIAGKNEELATIISNLREANTVVETINNDAGLKQKLADLTASNTDINQQLDAIVNSSDTIDQKMANAAPLDSILQPQLQEIWSGNDTTAPDLRNTQLLSVFIYSADFNKQVSNEVSKPLAQAFVAFMFVIMSLVATIPIIGMANRIHSEEKRGRIEPVFARSVNRLSMFGSYILITAIECVALMLCGALGIYAAAASTGLILLSDLIKAAFSYVPSLLAMMGISVLLVGLLPKLTGINWAVFGYSFFAVYFGRLVNMPEWTAQITPYGNIAQIPVETFKLAPIIILIALAVVLTIIGMFAFQKRDIETA